MSVPHTDDSPRAALVTGACSGIGLAMARQLAARGHPLVLVSDRADALRDVAAELRATHAIEVHAIVQDLAAAGAAVGRAPQRLEPEVRHLEAVAQRVRLLDPVHTLARGWSITRTADGRTVRDAAQVQPGEQIVTTFANGTARSRVEETQP